MRAKDSISDCISPLRVGAGVIALFLSGLFPAHASDDRIAVTERRAHYDITARGFEDAIRQIRRHARKNFDSSRHAAMTTVQFSFSMKTATTAGGCELKDYGVIVDIEYLMPRWTNKPRGRGENARRWNLFYAMLWRHERDHGKIAKAMARQLAAILSEVEAADTCGDVAKAAQAGVDDYVASSTAQQDYDRFTRHDPNRGSAFDIEAAVRR